MNQKNGKTVTAAAPVEMYRVRRIVDGMYLNAIPCGAYGDVNLRWWGPVDGLSPMEWTRKAAAVIAAAMMLLTGDHGIEIEPV